MQERNAPVLVLIHGLLSTPQEFALLSPQWQRHNIEVVAPRIPSFTEHPGAQPNSWHDWAASAVQVIDRMVAPERPIVLGGLCIGGVLAAALALQRPQRFSQVAMLSPTFTYDGWGLSPWTRWRHVGYALGLSRWIGVRERPPYGIQNPKIRARIANQARAGAMTEVGPRTLPLWAIREGERMMAWVRQRLAWLQAPTMVMHARQDEICRLSSVESLMQQIGARNKRLVVLENSYHMITIDNDRVQVARELADFCKTAVDSRIVSLQPQHDTHYRLDLAQAS